MLMPMLSEADPTESAEGSIDPLGMYPIADALASRMVPGVRERQTHPRFLTTIAASLSLCSVFDEDTVADDGVSEPWQVFEWYVVEGLARATNDPKLLRGLPGRDKADKARADGVPLSERRYLKGARTFGFHGIYRALAKEIGIETSGRLGDAGYEVLLAWETEQGLQGFLGNGDGPGRSHRQRLIDGITDGLKHGATARKTWGGFFAEHFGIYGAEIQESQQIRLSIAKDAGNKSGLGHRGEIFDLLTSEAGQQVWSVQVATDDASERRFHEWLIGNASVPLAELLTAIAAYERFSRYLQDAWEESLRFMALHKQRIKTSELASLASVVEAATILPKVYPQVVETLSPLNLADRFARQFEVFSEPSDAKDWVERLLAFHVKVQKDKPPAGKLPWLDRFDDGSFLIRPGYIREYSPRCDDAYVHAYRTNSLWSFASDLGLVV
ncbi:hypothetical protein Poly51_36230 [Rubripirellula tenax]|uniref:Uncharacterized protein n=1 Tax=Rubripirellula tenax TaxID=2528015 RepID=A0A5C6F5Z1_9BACT|nr:hypothetical protein [Rubripirellula tenax]TWU54901.1 hypothetical protein Poly51_36230 [Rubripirellula tenax]